MKKKMTKTNRSMIDAGTRKLLGIESVIDMSDGEIEEKYFVPDIDNKLDYNDAIQSAVGRNGIHEK